MKKFLFLIIVASLLVSATGCSSNTVTENSSDAANSSVNQSTSERTPPISENSVNSNASDNSQNPGNSSEDNSGSSKPENSTISSGENSGSSKPEDSTPSSGEKPGDGKPAYDDMFKGINSNTYVKGPDMTYDDVMEMLAPDERHPEWDADSFYLVETVKVLTLDECRELAGWDDNYADRVMYKVKVQKDLISGETVDRVENIFISMGNIEWQNKGDPIYAPGERFTVVLTKPYEGCDFLRTTAAFAFRYDAIEENGEIMLYSRGSELDELNMPTSVNIEESVITSTTKNPAIYSQKLKLTAFADYLREDWEKRGLTSHFEKKLS